MRNPNLILDSGAYTVFKKGTTIDIDKYAEFVKTHDSLFCNYFTLDEIGDSAKSYKQWVYLRSLGLNPIPVYHIGGDERYLQKYLKQTDYIGLGAIANLSSTQRTYGLDHIWNKYLLDANKKPMYKVHGLGITAVPLLARYPWFSVDSTSVIFIASYGKLFLPIWKNGCWDYINGIISKVSPQGAHKASTLGSFFAFSPSMQEKYGELFSQFGFSLGYALYMERQKTRAQKKEQIVRQGGFPYFPETSPISTHQENTLSHSYVQRLLFNLTMFNELKKSLQNACILYMGTSVPHLISAFQHITPKHDVMLSFAYVQHCKEHHFTALREYKENKVNF